MAYTLEDYTHEGGRPHSHAVYGDRPIQLLGSLAGKRVLDVGCGNGYWANQLKKAGADVLGADPSAQGVALAKQQFPGIRFEQVEVKEDLCETLGVAPFDIVTSFEVVEHLYDPRFWARSCFAALRPGGTLLCSTPYHGYLKNVALAVSGAMDKHFTVLWDGGHIKFWSPTTLSALLTEAGFRDITWKGYGRLPYLWMGMVMLAKKPG